MKDILNVDKLQKHFHSIDKAVDIHFLYYDRLPKIAFINNNAIDKVIEYFLNEKMFLKPPKLVVVELNDSYSILEYSNKSYLEFKGTIDNMALNEVEPIELTEDCAKNIVYNIYEENFSWLNDPKSKRAISAIPRIFSEPSVIIFELIQNAYDSNATKVKLDLSEDSFCFYHNGDKFTEADVNSISFVNLSTKDKDKVGFMGIGFKAIFLASDTPEIHSHPFSFMFNNKSSGGFILPQNINSRSFESGYSTFIYAPLRNQDVYKSLNDALLEQESANTICLSDKTFLHLVKADGNKTTGITDIQSPYLNLNIDKGLFDDTYIILSERKDKEKSQIEHWLRLERKIRPSKEEIIEFLEARDLKGSGLENEGWEESVSVVARLVDDNNKVSPDLSLDGLINVYLPTRIKTGMKFDVQGNFLVNAARDSLKNIDGLWNRRLFTQLADLCIDILIWCKKLSGTKQVLVASFYNLIPEWDEVNLSSKIINDVKTRFIQRFQEEYLVPIESDIMTQSDFCKPSECIVVEKDIYDLFGRDNLENYSRKKIVNQQLSKASIEKLVKYFGISVWSVNDTIDLLNSNTWEDTYRSFNTLKKWNRQLTKLYAYLFKQLGKQKQEIIEGMLRKCSIFPIEWNDETKDYILVKYEKELYRLHYESSQIDLTPFNKKVVLLHQSFDNYLRGREGNLEDEEKQNIEDSRKLLDIVKIKRLDPNTVINDFILPIFNNVELYNIAQVIDYTAYICKHYKEISDKKNVNIKLLDKKGKFCRPNQLYFSSNYEFNDLDIFFGDKDNLFVSSKYLDNDRASFENWKEFFQNIGVWKLFPLIYIKESISYFSERGKNIREELILPRPRASYYSDDYPANSYLITDLGFRNEVTLRLNEICGLNSKVKKDSMRAFLRILNRNWENYYSKYIKKTVTYYLHGQQIQYNEKPHFKIYEDTTYFSYLLNESWVPVINESDLKLSNEVLTYSEENISFSDDGILVCEEPISEKFADDLKFLTVPSEITNLDRLKRLVNRNVKSIEKYKEIYKEIFDDAIDNENKWLEVKNFFEKNSVIYANDRFWSSKQLIYLPDATISAYFPNLSTIYPEFKEVFINNLEISETQSSIYHIIQLFRDYIWKVERAISDEFRGVILYGYRRLLNYLEDYGDDLFKNTEEGKMFKLEAKVYCRKVGWVSIKESSPIVYLDVAKYDKNSLDTDAIYIESHLTQLKRDTSDLMPLLNLLNVVAASQSINEVYSYSGMAVVYPSYETIGKNLLYLITTMINILEEQEYDDGDKSKVSQFIKHLKSLKSYGILIYKVRDIKTMLMLNDQVLSESKKSCYIDKIDEVIRIYISDRIKIVYGSLKEELENLLRVSDLPIIQKDIISKLITNTIANIEDYFDESIQCFLIEGGYKHEQENCGNNSIITQDAEEQSAASSEEASNYDGENQEDTADESQEDAENGDNGGIKENGEKKNYVDIIKPINEDDISISDIDLDECDKPEEGSENPHNPHQKRKGGPKGRNYNNIFSKEDGDRGEEIVFKIEKKRLREIGLLDYVGKIRHISKLIPTNPWDIESFDKVGNLIVPIRIEVKSTVDKDNNTFPMSENELIEALAEKHPKGELYIYRVYGVREENPRIRRFIFKDFFNKKKINIVTKDVYVEIHTKK